MASSTLSFAFFWMVLKPAQLKLPFIGRFGCNTYLFWGTRYIQHTPPQTPDKPTLCWQKR